MPLRGGPMRVIVAVAASMLLLVGCTNTRPNTPPTSTGSWRVVPLNSCNTFPERCAILVNEQTGDTWIYSADHWTPVKRNQRPHAFALRPGHNPPPERT